jgi:hypothetical protein
VIQREGTRNGDGPAACHVKANTKSRRTRGEQLRKLPMEAAKLRCHCWLPLPLWQPASSLSSGPDLFSLAPSPLVLLSPHEHHLATGPFPAALCWVRVCHFTSRNASAFARDCRGRAEKDHLGAVAPGRLLSCRIPRLGVRRNPRAENDPKPRGWTSQCFGAFVWDSKPITVNTSSCTNSATGKAILPGSHGHAGFCERFLYFVESRTLDKIANVRIL